ncbi:MAG: PHP-associated domain-containing protein [Candidatus Acetothermia bacterium]
MAIVKADLHIHSVLSPCGSLEMSPRAILDRALEVGLDLIALTDHNAANNCRALRDYRRQRNVTEVDCLFGIEAQTREEVHLLCLFDRLEVVERFGGYLREYLPEVENNEEYFGEQLIVDPDEEITGREERLLANSLDLSLEEVAQETYRRGGVPIPAHVARKAFGILEQLGFIPALPTGGFEALELGPEVPLGDLEEEFGPLNQYTVIRSSDAHRPGEIGTAWTEMQLEKPSIEELRKAFRGEAGRGVIGYGKPVDEGAKP